jgi:hypothetical protein
MHRLVSANLEEFLNNPAEAPKKLPPEFKAHLDSCAECASQLRQMELQSQMLEALKAPIIMDPSAGFYARVIDRINYEVKGSIWSVFLQPGLARRIAYAAGTFIILLGTYLISTEPGVQNNGIPAVVTSQSNSFPDLQAPQQQDRDAVLVDLASYHE